MFDSPWLFLSLIAIVFVFSLIMLVRQKRKSDEYPAPAAGGRGDPARKPDDRRPADGLFIHSLGITMPPPRPNDFSGGVPPEGWEGDPANAKPPFYGNGKKARFVVTGDSTSISSGPTTGIGTSC